MSCAASADTVALFVVDQRMPHMTGTEFLARARPQFPGAKTVLLTAYADTDAAIEAINEVALDHYLLKPWAPPEERLYPIVDELLDDWVASNPPPYAGVRVIDTRWSPQGHEIKDFLARNRIPYRFYDMEKDPEARSMVEAARAGAAHGRAGGRVRRSVVQMCAAWRRRWASRSKPRATCTT